MKHPKPTKSEMLLVINDIHNRAIAARLAGGDDGTLMLEIEQLTEDVLVCFDETSEEITFTADDALPSLADVRGILREPFDE